MWQNNNQYNGLYGQPNIQGINSSLSQNTFQYSTNQADLSLPFYNQQPLNLQQHQLFGPNQLSYGIQQSYNNHSSQQSISLDQYSQMQPQHFQMLIQQQQQPLQQYNPLQIQQQQHQQMHQLHYLQPDQYNQPPIYNQQQQLSKQKTLDLIQIQDNKPKLDIFTQIQKPQNYYQSENKAKQFQSQKSQQVITIDDEDEDQSNIEVASSQILQSQNKNVQKAQGNSNIRLNSNNSINNTSILQGYGKNSLNQDVLINQQQQPLLNTSQNTNLQVQQQHNQQQTIKQLNTSLQQQLSILNQQQSSAQLQQLQQQQKNQDIIWNSQPTQQDSPSVIYDDSPYHKNNKDIAFLSNSKAINNNSTKNISSQINGNYREENQNKLQLNNKYQQSNTTGTTLNNLQSVLNNNQLGINGSKSNINDSIVQNDRINNTKSSTERKRQQIIVLDSDDENEANANKNIQSQQELIEENMDFSSQQNLLKQNYRKSQEQLQQANQNNKISFHNNNNGSPQEIQNENSNYRILINPSDSNNEQDNNTNQITESKQSSMQQIEGDSTPKLSKYQTKLQQQECKNKYQEGKILLHKRISKDKIIEKRDSPQKDDYLKDKQQKQEKKENLYMRCKECNQKLYKINQSNPHQMQNYSSGKEEFCKKCQQTKNKQLKQEQVSFLKKQKDAKKQATKQKKEQQTLIQQENTKSTNDGEEVQAKIMIGLDYQAKLPEFQRSKPLSQEQQKLNTFQLNRLQSSLVYEGYKLSYQYEDLYVRIKQYQKKNNYSHSDFVNLILKHDYNFSKMVALLEKEDKEFIQQIISTTGTNVRQTRHKNKRINYTGSSQIL